MKIGISTWVWTSPATTETLERLIPHIAALGYDVVELPVETPDQFDAHRARALAEENGLDVSVCAVIGDGRDLLLGDQRDAGVAYLGRCIEIAEVVGSPTVAGPFYSAVGRCWRQTSQERAADVKALSSILHELGDEAGERGIRLAIEPLNRFETSFLNTTEQALDLLDHVDHPAVGLALDLFHAGIEEKHPADAIRVAQDQLFHVQVAENDRGTPGTGHLPWSDVASALAEVEYEGCIVIETFSDRVEAIARAAAIWRPLAPDPDTLAREGLAFLRDLLTSVPDQAAARTQ